MSGKLPQTLIMFEAHTSPNTLEMYLILMFKHLDHKRYNDELEPCWGLIELTQR